MFSDEGINYPDKIRKLRGELDPDFGADADFKYEEEFLDPNFETTHRPHVVMFGAFTLDDLRKIIEAFEEPVELTDGGEAPILSVLSCEDCGLSYDQFGLDTTLPNDQWLLIHPSGEGGVLCATCIARRGHALPGVVAVRAIFDSPIELLNGGEAPKAPPIEKFMIYLVHEGDYENRTVVRAYIGLTTLGDDNVLEDIFISKHPELFADVGAQLDKSHSQYKYYLADERRQRLYQRYTEKFEDWLTSNLGLTAIPFMEIF